MGPSERLSTNDARILEVLQRDGRRPYADLGADVGMSGPSAHERVKKLEARRVITGYAAVVDPRAIGYDVLAFSWVTQAPGTVATRPDRGLRRDPRDRGVPPHHRRGRLPDQGPCPRHPRPRARPPPGPDDEGRLPDRDRRRLLERVRAAAAPRPDRNRRRGGSVTMAGDRPLGRRRGARPRGRGRVAVGAGRALRPVRRRGLRGGQPADIGSAGRRGGGPGDVPRALEPGRAVRPEGSGRSRAWLHTIARNRTVDRLRAAGRRPNLIPLSSAAGEDEQAGAALDRLVAAGTVIGGAAVGLGPGRRAGGDRARRTSCATPWRSLPDAERTAIVLAYREELTQTEIAERLGWPLGTVKTRTRRALLRLREALAEELGPGAAPTPIPVPVHERMER